MLTVAEVAKIIGISEPGVRRYIALGRLRAVRIGRRMLLVNEIDAQQFKLNPPGRPKKNG